MSRQQHDLVNDHFGTLDDAQLATGTPASGDAPLSNGDGTRTWGPAGGSGDTAWLLEPCVAASRGNITISTALNNGDSLDGVTLVTGDRVLVKDQSTGSQNGIYIVGASPARAADWDTTSDPFGKAVIVSGGAAYIQTLWHSRATAASVIGTDSITWASVAGPFTDDGGGTWKFRDFENEIADEDVNAYLYMPGGGTGNVDLNATGEMRIEANDGSPGVHTTDPSNAKHNLIGGFGMVIPRLSADPNAGDSENGQMYYNTSTHKFRGYANSTWVDLN